MAGRPKGKYNYLADQLEIAVSLDYETVEEAMIGEYEKVKCCIKVGYIFRITQDATIKRLKALGVKLRKKGFPVKSVKITTDSYIDIMMCEGKTGSLSKKHGISCPTVLKIKRGYMPTLI